MKSVKVSLLLVFFLVLLFGTTIEVTHAVSEGVTSTGIALSATPTATQLGVPNPSFWNFLRLRIARSLTFSVVNKIEITNDLTSMRLLTAKNEPKKLSEAIKDFENEKNQIAKLEQKDPAKNDDSLKQKLAKEDILQTMILDDIKVTDPTDDVSTQRDATISDAIENLHDLGKVKIKEVLDEVDDVIKENEDEPETEVIKQFEVEEELNDHENEAEDKLGSVDDDDEFDQAIAENDAETQDKVAKLPADVIQKVAASIATNLQRHLIVLEGILAKVPDSAKPAMQKVINDATARMVEKLQKEDNLIEKMFEGTKVSDDIENNIINRLEKQAEKDKKSIEKALEKFKKQDEKQAEENKKQAEKKAEEAKKQEEKKQEEQKKAAEKASEEAKNKLESQAEKDKKEAEKAKEDSKKESGSSDSNNSTPSSNSSNENSGSNSSGSSSTEVEKQDIEIKAKDMAFEKMSITVKKDAQVTVKFKNEDDTPHSLVLNDYGLSTSTLGKDGEATLTFIATKNTSFHCGIHPSMTGSITIQ